MSAAGISSRLMAGASTAAAGHRRRWHAPAQAHLLANLVVEHVQALAKRLGDAQGAVDALLRLEVGSRLATSAWQERCSCL